MQNIVTGNDFTLIVDARRQETASQRFDLRVLERLEIYLVMAGRAKVLQSYTLDELGRAVIEVGGDVLPVGVWGVELVGTYQMANVRSTNAKAFKIVDGLNQLGLSGDGIEIVVEVNVLSNAEATRPYVDAAIADHDADVTSHSDIRTELAQKVSDIKVDGISIVDGNKVANLDSDDFGKVDDVKVNGVSVVSNKEAAITMPTKVSDLANDSQFTTKSYVDGEVAQAGHVDDVQVNGTSVVSGKVASVTMPTKVSDLPNDADYRNATQVQSAINTAIDANFINEGVGTVDGTTGTPSVDIVKDGTILRFAFHNIKGAPFTFADFTPEQKEELRGEQGATGVYDQTTQDFLTTLETTTGQSQTKTMTQKAITDAINEGTYTGEFSQLDFSGYTRQKKYINGSNSWASVTTTTSSSCYMMPINGWKWLKLHPRVVDNVAQDFQIAFLTSEDTMSGTPKTAGSTTTAWVRNPEDDDYIYEVPSDAAYLYVRYNSGGDVYMPTYIGRDVSVADTIAMTKQYADNVAEEKSIKAAYAESIWSEIEVDTENVTTLRWFINESNVWQQASNDDNMHGHLYIKDVKRIKVIAETSFNIEFLTAFPTPTSGGSPSFACPRIGFVVAGTYYFDVPPTAKYLYFRKYSSGVNRTPAYIGAITTTNQHIANTSNTEREKELFLGTLLQKSLTASGLGESTVRVSTASCMAVPHVACTLHFELPFGIGVGIRSGNRAENLSNNNFWILNGDTFTFDASARFFRLCFAKSDVWSANTVIYDDVTPSDINAYIEQGLIHITYAEDGDIITRNGESEKYTKAIMRTFASGIDNPLDKLAVFAHTSDVHGDAKRFAQFLDYCDFLGVDAALVSGDMVAYNASNAEQYINDLADLHTTKVMACVGNHDVRSVTTAQAQNESTVGYLISKNESVAPDEYPTYYYHDFSAKKIRLISLNLYELEHTGDNVNFTQTQCEWFIEALASTPANYGVIVMFHSPEVMPVQRTGFDTFYQPIFNYSTCQVNISGNPFAKIIDAFIGKTTLSLSYMIGSTTISVSADFENVASGVEFIAFVNGHLHADAIGDVPNTEHLQLNLNVTCCSSVYGTDYPNYANLSDTPRGGKGATQDCFNVYAIDRDAKTVRVARVGSNITSTLAERKVMIIPYK